MINHDQEPEELSRDVPALWDLPAVRDRRVRHRRRAEKAFQESARRFRALVENSWDGITLIDAAGVILFTSPATTRILGYEIHEFVGRNAFDLIHPEEAAEARGLLARLLQDPGARI